MRAFCRGAQTCDFARRAKRIKADVVWERLPAAPDFFPHIYGPLPLAAVEDVSLIPWSAELNDWDWETFGKRFLN